MHCNGPGLEVLTVGWKVDAGVDGEEVVHLPLAAVLGGEGGGGDLHLPAWRWHWLVGVVVHLLGFRRVKLKIIDTPVFSTEKR